MTLRIDVKLEEKMICCLKNDTNLVNFDLSLKILTISTFFCSFCTKYITFDLKEPRGVMFHDNLVWCKIWTETNSWFGKWHEEYSTFLPEHFKNLKIDAAWKAIFFSPNIPKRWSFQKKLHWNMILLILSRKIVFIFPENMILFFRRKMKDDLSQKNTWKYYIFVKCSKKTVFPKKSLLNMILLVLSGNMVFFPENVILFFWTENERWSFSKNTCKFDIFLYICINGTNMIFSQERVLVVLCTCMETFRGVFIYCFPVKKARKFDFFFNLFGWRYSAMKNLQYSVPFSPQELYLEVSLKSS